VALAASGRLGRILGIGNLFSDNDIVFALSVCIGTGVGCGINVGVSGWGLMRRSSILDRGSEAFVAGMPIRGVAVSGFTLHDWMVNLNCVVGLHVHIPLVDLKSDLLRVWNSLHLIETDTRVV